MWVIELSVFDLEERPLTHFLSQCCSLLLNVGNCVQTLRMRIWDQTITEEEQRPGLNYFRLTNILCLKLVWELFTFSVSWCRSSAEIFNILTAGSTFTASVFNYCFMVFWILFALKWLKSVESKLMHVVCWCLWLWLCVGRSLSMETDDKMDTYHR